MCSCPFSILLHVKSAKISIKGQYRNAFLAYCFRSRKQVQRYEKVSNTQNFFAILKKRCIFAVEKYVNLYRKIE